MVHSELLCELACLLTDKLSSFFQDQSSLVLQLLLVIVVDFGEPFLQCLDFVLLDSRAASNRVLTALAHQIDTANKLPGLLTVQQDLG